MRSLSLRPDDSLTILKDGFVNRFQSFGFPTLCYSSYEAPDYYLGGLFPTEHTSLSLDMHRYLFLQFFKPVENNVYSAGASLYRRLHRRCG